MKDFEQVKRIIEESKTICLTAHLRPDGDAIGSLGAMYYFLKEIGKEVYWILPTVNPRYLFLPGIDESVSTVPLSSYDLLICLDTSDEKRLNISEEDILKAKKRLIIDHHKTNNMVADVSYVDGEAPANCENIYNLIKYMGHSISKNIADYIYLGIMTDTGSFNYERTTGHSYRIAGEMLDDGADFVNICKIINDTHSETRMKLIAYLIEHMETYCNGQVRIGRIDLDVQKKFNATETDIDGLTNYLRCIEGTKVSIYIRALDEKEYKFSIRSEEPVDASVLATEFGGGGHKRAAGFETTDLEETKKKVVRILERLLESENNRNT